MSECESISITIMALILVPEYVSAGDTKKHVLFPSFPHVLDLRDRNDVAVFTSPGMDAASLPASDHRVEGRMDVPMRTFFPGTT